MSRSYGLVGVRSEEVFDQIEDCWELQGREQSRGPFKGRLANSLAEYPETLNLKTEILVQPVGTRPLFVIEESEHPLAIEQSFGITRDGPWDGFARVASGTRWIPRKPQRLGFPSLSTANPRFPQILHSNPAPVYFFQPLSP